MTTINVEVDGPDGIARHIEAMVQEYPRVAAQAAWQEFSTIMNATKPKVPVEFGMLRASGKVQEPVVAAGEIIQVMGYYTEYAEYVEHGQPHTLTGEEPFHHIGQAHFMEETFNEFAPNILENIAKRIDSMIAEVR